jgi:hypothetical protein
LVPDTGKANSQLTTASPPTPKEEDQTLEVEVRPLRALEKAREDSSKRNEQVDKTEQRSQKAHGQSK